VTVLRELIGYLPDVSGVYVLKAFLAVCGFIWFRVNFIENFHIIFKVYFLFWILNVWNNQGFLG